MTESRKLLREYVANGSETGFRELVDRYVNLVYSAAFRMTQRDAHLSQDIAQIVFSDLARRASSLSENILIGGWLHRRTCFVAATIMRSHRRRLIRERHAVEMNMLHPQSNFPEIRPFLDAAINKLPKLDRAAILLRFFEQRDFRSIGDIIGASEDAARMRVARALEKLHDRLQKQGVTSSAAALTVALTSEAMASAPATLAAGIATSALAGATKGAGATFTFLKLMSLTKLQSGSLGALLIAGATAVLLVQHQTENRLRDQNQAFARQIQELQADKENLGNQLGALQRENIARELAAARQASQTALNRPAVSQATNFYERFRNEWPKLDPRQVQAYLKENHRDAASLLAAFRTTGDKSLLQEAMKNYPNDPEVAFEAIFKSDSSPQEKRQWLDAFEKSAPDNALANYLSAREYLKAGDTAQALQELAAATGKPAFQDYSLDRMQNNNEALLGAGYSPTDARVVSSRGLLLPQLSELKQLSIGLLDVASSYEQSGDAASAQSVLQMTLDLGQRYYDNAQPGETEISKLVGMAIERMALAQMDPAAPYGNSSQTVQDRIDQLSSARSAMRDIGDQFEAIVPNMSEQDYVNFKERWMILGQQAAQQWALAKYASQ